MSYVHPTATLDADVVVGKDTSIWGNVQIRRGTRIGVECIVGHNASIAYEVAIGDRVKINSLVSICHGVSIANGVMIGAGTVFTNDRYPRATDPGLGQLRTSEPTRDTLTTHVEEGATIGANCTIGPGIRIGRFAMIGMGSVLTRSVGDFILAAGSPARPHGVVCRCGEPCARFAKADGRRRVVICPQCDRRYRVKDLVVHELDTPAPPDRHE